MEIGRSPAPITLPTRKGRALWHFGALLTFKALGVETDGQYWALEGLADQRMAVPLHKHSREDEIWFVLEGELAFTIGAETRTAGPGAFVYIPRDVPHTFRVRSQTARWFGLGLPGCLDQWFFETGEPANALTLPPSAPTDANAIHTLIATLKAYGTDILGPPLQVTP